MHIIVALVLCLFAAFYKNDIENFMMAVPLIIISSLLPDIDIGTSIIRKLVFALSIAFAFALWLFTNNVLYSAIVLIVYILTVVFIPRHRGFTHSIVALLLYTGFIFFIIQEQVVYAFISYASHLIADLEIKII